MHPTNRHSMDAKKYAQEQNDLETNHHLTLTTVESGHLLINGVLDPVGGAAVRGALGPLARQSGQDDLRRRAHGDLEAFVGAAPHSHAPDGQVAATLQTLEGQAGA